MARKKEVTPILPDESIVAVGIDVIKTIVGGLEVTGKFDYDGQSGNYKFDLGYGWEHSSIKEIEHFIQAELSRKLCTVN